MWMQLVIATKLMQPNECNQMNATYWMKLIECIQVNAPQ